MLFLKGLGWSNDALRQRLLNYYPSLLTLDVRACVRKGSLCSRQ